MRRPDPSEYFEYYGRYVDLVPDGDIIAILAEEMLRTLDVLAAVPPDLADYRYAPEKWTVKEVIGHVIDAERVFGYRALHFARRDPASLPSMEENEWARASNAAARSMESLAKEYALVRESHIALLKGFDEEMSTLKGTASGYEFSVRTFPYLMAGHEIHHRGVLLDRYLGSGGSGS
ncbi:MAG: DinB family protein [Gemmatimonadota bacterium]|nr:MAG: DinB family protein [Gemmatimonadota bacterium]